MRDRFAGSMMTVAIAAAVGAGISVSVTPASAQAPAARPAPAAAPKTPWGEPDLQGIWTDETDTPLQRSPKYANQEFFTAAQRENWTGSDRPCCAATSAWSAAPSSTSPAPTTRCSCPRSAPARAPR